MTQAQPPARFIHSSDWQLGMTRAFLGDEAAARFSQARIDAIGTLGRLASKREAQFIVVAGDVFESNQLSPQTLLRTVDALEALPVPVFLLPGNHDPLDGSSIFGSAPLLNASPHVIVLRDEAPVPVSDVEGVEVVGAPWRSKRPSTDLCAQLAASLQPSTGVTRIAVCHGQVDTLSPDPDRPEIIRLAAAEQAIADTRFHYLALGDRHSLTEIGATGRIHYSGAPVATAFDEERPNHALLVDLTADGCCQVEALGVGEWHFVAQDHSINGSEDLAAFRHWLTSLPDKERTVVKTGFTGSVNLRVRADLDTLLEQQATLFASLRQRQRTSSLTVVPDQLDRDSVALSGYAQTAWQQLIALSESADRDQARVAQDALRLLYRLSDASGAV
ncbi:MAG: exonuclease SbcCD subunit D [Pseudomonadota bacterium]